MPRTMVATRWLNLFWLPMLLVNSLNARMFSCIDTRQTALLVSRFPNPLICKSAVVRTWANTPSFCFASFGKATPPGSVRTSRQSLFVQSTSRSTTMFSPFPEKPRHAVAELVELFSALTLFLLIPQFFPRNSRASWVKLNRFSKII